MSKPRGLILYTGPSELDGEPIIVVATLSTNNRKTGDMIQTWILRDNVTPVQASKAGMDKSVCGNCPQRHSLGGACYVNIGQAPQSVYKAYKRGSYPVFDKALHLRWFMGRRLRLGAYGDPSAMPFDTLSDTGIMDVVLGHTGYTHQIRHDGFDSRWLDLLMVSADTKKQADKARAMGARYFRVTRELDIDSDTEVHCLADSKGINCADCLKCDGAGKGKSIVIAAHGSRASKFLNNDIIARG